MKAKPAPRVAIYARVSTRDKGQEVENQLAQLREYCDRQEWPIQHEYIDHKTGSTAARDEFQEMLSDAQQRRFDLVLFWALDRFSREGALATLQHLQTLTAAGVAWKSYTEQYLDSAGPFKDAVIAIMATLAKQERGRISERTLAGLATARAKGKILGRPRRVVDLELARRLLFAEKPRPSMSAIGRALGISRIQVYRLQDRLETLRNTKKRKL